MSELRENILWFETDEIIDDHCIIRVDQFFFSGDTDVSLTDYMYYFFRNLMIVLSSTITQIDMNDKKRYLRVIYIVRRYFSI